VPLAAARDAARHQVGRQRGAAGHAHLAQPLRGQAADLQQAFVQRIQHARGMALQQAACVSQFHLARGAVQKLHAQGLLQLGDIAADGGLGQCHQLARAAEVAAFGHGQEGAQLAQADIHTEKL
jgi:hypothetical protein